MQAHLQLANAPTLPSIRAIGFSGQRLRSYVNSERELHSHDVVELFLVLNGEGTHLVEDGEFPLTRGVLGVVNFGQSHAILTESQGMDIVNLYIDPRWLGMPQLSGDLAAALPRLLPIAPGMVHHFNRVTQHRLDNASRISTILLALVEEAESQHPQHLDAMIHYMHLFVIECARFACRQLGANDSPVPPPMLAPERIRCHIEKNWRDEIRLDDLAARAHMSKEHLCRLFRRHTGRTIVEYIHHRRIERAMVLLNSTDEKVINIAFDSGFGDLAHFNRVFRRITGQTPSQFRKRSTAAES